MKKVELKVFTDGGARGNPGPAASAFVLLINGDVIKKESRFLGIATNNIAEYQGVLLALRWLKSNNIKPEVDKINFYLDSELVVRQLNGVYKVRDEKLLTFYSEILLIIKRIGRDVVFKHVPRSQNKIADSLVNIELDSQ
jgi:ribonuclease HI